MTIFNSYFRCRRISFIIISKYRNCIISCHIYCSSIYNLYFFTCFSIICSIGLCYCSRCQSCNSYPWTGYSYCSVIFKQTSVSSVNSCSIVNCYISCRCIIYLSITYIYSCNSCCHSSTSYTYISIINISRICIWSCCCIWTHWQTFSVSCYIFPCIYCYKFSFHRYEVISICSTV